MIGKSKRPIIEGEKFGKLTILKQIENKGFSMVEILSACPTYWKMSPKDAAKHIENEVASCYPLGVLVER